MRKIKENQIQKRFVELIEFLQPCLKEMEKDFI